MQESDIYARLAPIFHEVFEDESIVLTPALTAADVPGWNSFQHVNLVVSIEEAFGIRFQAAEVESMHNLAAMAHQIQTKVAAS
jgi:acyl carrier protein